MKQKFDINDRIGDIVTQFPLTTEVFKAYNIDFCCGGKKPLQEVIAEKGANEQEVVQKLNKAVEKQENLDNKSNWKTAKFSDLIDYIVSTHHAYLNQELPILSELVTKILRVHGPNHEDLSQVHKLFHTLKMDMEQHLIKEEEILFPLIKGYEEHPSQETLEKVKQVIQDIESEHEDAGELLRKLREVTEDYKLPEDACRTFALTYQKLEELESDIFQHVHLENNILFDRL